MLAADLGTGTDDPRATAPDLLRRALAALPGRARAGGRVGLRAPIGFYWNGGHSRCCALRFDGKPVIHWR